MMKISIASVLAAASAQALAGEAAAPPDTREWTCSACPFDKGYQADVSAGVIYATGANAASGRFTGIDRETAYVDAGARGAYVKDDGTFATYALNDLGLDSRSGAIKFGRYGHFDVALTYDGLPNRRYDTTMTPFSGGAVQTLPDTWVQAGSTAGMTDLAADLNPARIGTLRKNYGLAGRWMPGHGLALFASFDRQDKTGTQIVGASFMTQAMQLAAPVDFKTETIEVGAAWAGNGLAWRFSASDSKFKNDQPVLTFMNPYLPLEEYLSGPAVGAISRAPENEARSWNFTVSAALPFNSSASIAAGTTTLKNHSALLPVNTQPDALPPSEGFDSNIRLTHIALTLASHPWSRVNAHGRVAYDNREDLGNALALEQFLTDIAPGPTVVTPRFGFKRIRLDGGIDVRLLKSVTVGVAGDRVEIEREQQLVRHTEDGRTYGRLKWTPGYGVTIVAKGGAGHKQARGVDLTYLPFGQDPRVAMYNLANRDRDFGDLDANWAISDKLTFGVQGSVTNDRYGRSVLGLLNGRERRGAATLTFVPTEQWSFYVDGGWQTRETKQAGAFSATSATWDAAIMDRFTNIGAGTKYTGEKCSLGIDLAQAKSIGETSVGLIGALAGYPDLRTRFNSAKVTLGCAATERLSVKFRYAYQNYAAYDWAMDGVGPATSLNLLALGADSGSYNTNIFGLSFGYRFGGTASQ
jgi:MtrB/PioB family decaheme-associated outer membrane protein